MKKMKYLMWFLIVPLLAGMILTDCKKSDDDPPPPAAVDFAVLDTLIGTTLQQKGQPLANMKLVQKLSCKLRLIWPRPSVTQAV